MEKQTCPRRMLEMGSWEYKENLDTWDKTGPDRTCSFCGSMHPEDFEKFVERVLIDESYALEHSTKNYKIYTRRFKNEDGLGGDLNEGAIKYYKQHNYTNDEDIERLVIKYDPALRVSKERLQKRLNEAVKIIKDNTFNKGDIKQ